MTDDKFEAEFLRSPQTVIDGKAYENTEDDDFDYPEDEFDGEPSLLDLEIQEKEDAAEAEQIVAERRAARAVKSDQSGVAVTLNTNGAILVEQNGVTLALDMETALFVMGRLGAAVNEVITARSEVRKVNPKNL
jgi:hypothetical protein